MPFPYRIFSTGKDDYLSKNNDNNNISPVHTAYPTNNPPENHLPPLHGHAGGTTHDPTGCHDTRNLIDVIKIIKK